MFNSIIPTQKVAGKKWSHITPGGGAIMVGRKRYYKKPDNYDAIKKIYEEHSRMSRKTFGKIDIEGGFPLSNIPREMLYELFKPRFYEKELKPLIEGTILECPFCGGVMKKHAGYPTEIDDEKNRPTMLYQISVNQFSVPTGDGRNYYCETCMTIISPTGKLLVRAGRILIPIKEEK